MDRFIFGLFFDQNIKAQNKKTPTHHLVLIFSFFKI